MLAQVEIAITRAGPGVVLRDARLPRAMAPAGLPVAGDGLVAADLWLADGRIEAITPPGRAGDGRAEVALARAMAWALPVDAHAHVDKGQTWARRPNPDGTFAGALTASGAENAGAFDEADLRARAGFILDCAAANGTAAIRSHVDATAHRIDRAFAVMRELAADCADQLALQLAPFTGLGEDPALIERLAVMARDAGTGILSAFLYRDPGLGDFLDRIFTLAARFGLSLDFHADETLDPDSHCLRAVAETAIRHRFEAPIVVGHACALSVQPADEATRTLDLAQEAGIGIVALPLCNAHLQDRGAGSPRRRGVAPVKEIAAAGVPVALASDNVRDPFHAYGDMDMAEVFRQSVQWLQLDHPVGDWPALIGPAPAAMIGRADLGRLAPGGAADLMILPARNWSEFTARPARDRIVLRGGIPQDTTPPPFSRLDGLKGMNP